MAEFFASGEVPEVLFWVGCAGSFDQRAQKITKAFATILNKTGISFGYASRPVLIFALAYGIDDAGNVTGAGKDETHGATEISRAEQDRFRRRDVILLRRQVIDRYRHLF